MASQRESVEASESEVAVHWKEEEYFYPPRDFIAQANMTDEKIYERFSLGACLGISIQVTSMDDQSVQVASIRPQCLFAPIPAA